MLPGMETKMTLVVLLDELTGPIIEGSDECHNYADEAEFEATFDLIYADVVEQLRVRRYRLTADALTFGPRARDFVPDVPEGKRPWEVSDVEYEPMPEHLPHKPFETAGWQHAEDEPQVGERVRVMIPDPLCWHDPQGWEPFAVGVYEGCVNLAPVGDGRSGRAGGLFVRLRPDPDALLGETGVAARIEAFEHERSHIREDGSGCTDLMRYGPLQSPRITVQVWRP
jgi:hypothetical protein